MSADNRTTQLDCSAPVSAMSGRPGRGAGGRPRGAKMEGETVIAGVDTHKDVHVLCLLDGLGRKIWSGSFGADPEGYDRLAEAIGDPGSDPRVEREDGPAQAQPRRQPAGELGALRDRDQAHGVRREDEEVRGEADLRGEVPAGGGPLPEALHSAGGVPRAHGPEPRRRRAGRPRAREDAQGDAGDSEESRRGARPVRSHTRALGTGETAVNETGEEVLRAPVRIGENAPANCLLTTYRSVGFTSDEFGVLSYSQSNVVNRRGFKMALNYWQHIK